MEKLIGRKVLYSATGVFDSEIVVLGRFLSFGIQGTPGDYPEQGFRNQTCAIIEWTDPKSENSVRYEYGTVALINLHEIKFVD
jgi:hypothetical protein